MKNNNTLHLKDSFQYFWPFCLKQPTPCLIERLRDHHEFLGLVLWYKLYIGVILSMLMNHAFVFKK